MKPRHITLHARRSQTPAQFGAEGCWLLEAEKDWVVHGDEATLLGVAHALPAHVVERVAPEVLMLKFGNAVGHFRAGPLGLLKVTSGKFGEHDYDRLLERISEVAASLPFSAHDGAAMPFERAVMNTDEVLYHAFIYLRHIMGSTASPEDALKPALESVLRRPHRRLHRIRRSVSVEAARRVDVRALQDVVAGRWPMTRVSPALSPVAVALGGQLPVMLEEVVARDTFDTPENRFVKALLSACRHLIDAVRRRAVTFNRRWLARSLCDDCDAMARALMPVVRHPMWQQVGRMTLFPASSTVLQHRAGYRTLFKAHNRLHLGSRLPLDAQDTTTLLAVKNIALLYEMWCCFAVIDAVRGVLGEPAEVERFRASDFEVTVPWTYRAQWSNGVSVQYNPHFSNAASNPRRSYSLQLRPDIVLSIPPALHHGGLHIFDAKFKLRRETSQASAVSGEGSKAQDAGFKPEDIYKMHTYRDAIPAARTAWVLYPGKQERFFRLHAEGGGPWEGVGAIPLSVEAVSPSLTQVVRRLLAQHEGANP